MNRLQLRTAALKKADAYGSGRWDATPGGEVDGHISDAFDQLWRQILNANEDYLVAKRTPTSDATGRYQLSELTVAVGDELQRLYRIKGVYIDGRKYEGPVSAKQYAAAEIMDLGVQFVWYQEGQAIVALPIQANKAATAIMVNYQPQRPDQFEGDDSTVQFPDGHEKVLVYWSAAEILTKGGAETQASLELRAFVQDAHDELLESVGRLSTNPRTLQYSDDPGEWGG